MKPCAFFLSLFVAATTSGLVAREARACGGCFHARTNIEPSVVTDHRMVVSISKTQTVLWDQVRYSGNPSEFAWVLPVTAGSRIELGREEWIGALDAATATQVDGPHILCPGWASSSSGGCQAPAAYAGADPKSAETQDWISDAGVQIVREEVVGPYEAVTLRADKGDSLETWLDENGFAIPANITPVLSAYARARFDFIALRLRPGFGTRAMRPVRVIMPGVNPVLPLRMVAAGVGQKVGLTLWVISEGRYEVSNFPTVTIDEGKLAYNPHEQRSNYRELLRAALAENGGSTWVAEHASSWEAFMAAGSLYRETCQRAPHIRVLCGARNGALPGEVARDAAVSTGGHDDAQCVETRPACSEFDDDILARADLSDVWVTKLKGELTPEACASADLILSASMDPSPVKSRYTTDSFTDATFNPCGSQPNNTGGNAVGSPAGDTGCACRAEGHRQPPLLALVALVATACLLARRNLSRAVSVARTKRR